MTMWDSTPEWRRQLAVIAADIELEGFTPGEPDQDGCLTWWQLSFVGDDGWLGWLLIEAPSFVSAVRRAHMLGLNPGGEVMAAGFRARSVPDGYANRLITSRAEVEDMPEPDIVEIVHPS